MTPTARKHALIDLQRLDAKQWLPQKLETLHGVLHVYWKQGLKDAYPTECALLAATAPLSGNEPASVCAVRQSLRWWGFCDRWRRYTETDEYRKLSSSVESRMRCRNLRPGSRPLLGQNWNTSGQACGVDRPLDCRG